MTIEQLRAAREAVPFQPFVIHMIDGRFFRVPHPDYLWIPPNGRHAVVVRADGNAAESLDPTWISDLTSDGNQEAREP